MKKIIGLIILLVARSSDAIQKPLSKEDAIGMMQHLRPLVVKAAKKIRADLDDDDYERLKKILNAKNTARILQSPPKKNESKSVIINDCVYVKVKHKSVSIQLNDNEEAEEFKLRRDQVLIIALAPNTVENDEE